MSPTATALVAQLRSMRNARNVAGMRGFGIRSRHEQLGVGVTPLRRIARDHRRDHALARELWGTGVLEAMILGTLVADPRVLTRRDAAGWVRRCDNWAMTDALAFVVDRTGFAVELAMSWSGRPEEFTKRAGFAVMAGMAVHRKELPDAVFLSFLPVIRREAGDDRNFVKKAVNWALRQIGKRNPALRRAALAEARRIARLDCASARWIARDARRELEARG